MSESISSKSTLTDSSKLKEELSIPIHMQTHATTGMSTATNLKAIEAGIDNIDTSISSMSMTYGHSSTETLVSMLQDTDLSLDFDLLKQVVNIKYFSVEKLILLLFI